MEDRKIVVVHEDSYSSVAIMGVFDSLELAITAIENHISGNLQFVDGSVRASAPPYDNWCDSYLFIDLKLNELYGGVVTN